VREPVAQTQTGAVQSSNTVSKICGRCSPAWAFAERIRGDHHIFSKTGVAEILNLRPCGSLAKPYQVKQVRAVIVRYKLAERIE
jgi:hypothetical protein